MRAFIAGSVKFG